MAKIAFTRPVPASIARCELSHLVREPIDLGRARTQHAAYEQELVGAGFELVRLTRTDHLPDSVFVEDVAVALDRSIVLTRPGAASRRAEVESAAEEFARWLPIARMHGEARLDGGDVLRLGRTLFVGRSARTDSEGVRQLRALAAGEGLEVRELEVDGCLHLKTALAALDDRTVLANPRWVDAAATGREVVEVDAREPFGANVLVLGDRTLVSAAHPRTADRLRARGLAVREIDVSELAKAEAGLSCCSLLLDSDIRPEAA